MGKGTARELQLERGTERESLYEWQSTRQANARTTQEGHRISGWSTGPHARGSRIAASCVSLAGGRLARLPAVQVQPARPLRPDLGTPPHRTAAGRARQLLALPPRGAKGAHSWATSHGTGSPRQDRSVPSAPPASVERPVVPRERRGRGGAGAGRPASSGLVRPGGGRGWRVAAG